VRPPAPGMTTVASEISRRACQVEASVSVCTPSTSCFTLMPRPTLSLRVFFQNKLAVIVRVEFLLANLEDAILPPPSASSFVAAARSAFIAVVLGSKSIFDLTRVWAYRDSFSMTSSVSLPVADNAAIMLKAINCRRSPISPRLVDGSLRLGRIVLGEIGGSEDAVELRMGVDQCGTGGGNEAAWALRSAWYSVSCWRRSPTVARRRAQALDGVVDVLDGFASAATTVLSAPSSMRRPSLSTATCWVSLIFLARSFSASSVRKPAAPVPDRQDWRSALQVAAGGETGNVPTAEIGHRHAEMSQHQAGAGADDDGHAAINGEGGEETAPDAPIADAASQGLAICQQ